MCHIRRRGSAALIQLRDTIFIDAPPEKVWAWLADLPAHYQAWHPAHIRCWYERGHPLEVGAVLVVEEDLHGRVHRLKLHVTESAPKRLLQYASWGLRGAFLLEAADRGTRFTATLGFGVAAPLIGRIVDRVLGPLFATRLAAVQTHMHEEGRNLQRLLEQRKP